MELSILIPVYNYVCTELVKRLHQQAAKLGIRYEIVVADDGSADHNALTQNKRIASIPCCIYIERQINIGRAAIRNYLAQTAKYRWLIFLDCDMQVPDNDFLKRYIAHTEYHIVDGGISVGGNMELNKHNLRFLYESKCAPMHTVDMRSANPYKSFRTTNFMIQRDVMLSHPFDERFRHYGYEDVLFGKHLKQAGIVIKHINNPMILTDYEPNDIFVCKSEEAMNTLFTFKKDLRGYSHIITAADTLNHAHLVPIIKLAFKLSKKIIRKNLAGSRPWLYLFNFYKLGYYLSLTKQ